MSKCVLNDNLADNMSYNSSSCPFDIHLKHGTQQILAHDRVRAQKFMQGLHPHGPVALWEAPTSSSTEQVGEDEIKSNPQPSPVIEADPTAAADRSLDITDAGVSNHLFLYLLRIMYFLLRRYVYYDCRRWKPAHPIQASDRHWYVNVYLE